ncbi:alpha-1,2-fucosyltransferase [Polaribacter sp. M15]
MSLCKNNITANSSFSWWGAWLNKNKEKIVISPKQWYVSKKTNIICDDWIKL